MDVGRIEKLTDKQRECLQLVLKHYTSKEMARELGIGVDAVDQRLKSAMRKLGATTRIDAARILAAHEGLPAPGAQPEHDVPQPVTLSQPSLGSVAPIMDRTRPGKRMSLAFIKRIVPRTRRGWFVLLACLISLVFGDVAYPLDLFLQDRQVAARLHPSSGDIISLEIDKKSVQALGLTPWPRRYYTQIFHHLDKLGAAKIVFWGMLNRRGEPGEDRELAAQLQSMGGRVVFVVIPDDSEPREPLVSLPEFRSRAGLAQGALIVALWTPRRAYYRFPVESRSYPSAFLELANVTFEMTQSRIGRLAQVPYESFPIDYTIDARTIPAISAIDVIRGNISPGSIAGKTVSLGESYRPPVYQLYAPVIGKISNAQARILAAETLVQGVPTEVPWTIPFFPTMLVVIACGLIRKAWVTLALFGVSIVGLLLLPTILFPSKTYIYITSALFLVLLVGAGFTGRFVQKAYQSRRRKAVAPGT